MPELSDADRLSDVADVVQQIKEMNNVAVVREYKTKTKTETPGSTELKITVDVEHDPDANEEQFSLAVEGKEERVKTVKSLIAECGEDNGAEINTVVQEAVSEGMDEDAVRSEIEKLRRQGDVYEPMEDMLRVV